MKSGSSSAVALGRVLQAIRKRASKNQADVAASFWPKLSIAAISMAESWNRPPKTLEMVRSYATALGIDDEELLELWWAMQGMVEVEDWADERRLQRWWHELRADPQVEINHLWAERKAAKESTPDEEQYAPTLNLFTLAGAICKILGRLLGDTWKIDQKLEIGVDDPINGRSSTVMIELQAGGSEGGGSTDSPRLMVTFACPEPVTRPIPHDKTPRPNAETISPDVAWILASVESMPARERAAVAGFIHRLREGASLYPGVSLPTHPTR